VIVLFSAGARETFARLPEPVKHRAARSIELLASNPHMYPVRRRGIMRGYRYFVAYSVLFYYSASSTEIRVSATQSLVNFGGNLVSASIALLGISGTAFLRL
jgi:hypothetical protein